MQPNAEEPQFAAGQWVDPRARLHTNVEQFMARVFTWMSIATLVTAGVAYGISTSQAALEFIFLTPMRWVVLFGPLAFVWVMGSRIPQMDDSVAKGTLLVYAAMIGAMLSYIPVFYSAASIFGCFVVTAGMFAATAAFGYMTKKDLSGFGRFLQMSVIGLIIAWVASIFIPGLYFWVAAIGVFLFAGLTAYDTQRLKQFYLTNGAQGNLATVGALLLYVNFINMFIFLLHLFGGRE